MRSVGGDSSAAAALRLTRQQLDARVAQILGKHGHANTADLITPPPVPDPAEP